MFIKEDSYLAPLIRETIRYGVDKKHLTYIGSYPICINMLRLERIFKRYALNYDVIEGFPLPYSWSYLKAILRNKSATQSNNFSLFIDQPKELRDIPMELTWRFVPATSINYKGNYDEIVDYWLETMSDRDIRSVYGLTDKIFYNMLSSHPNYHQFFKNAVILFDIIKDTIHMFSIGDIQSYRYRELTDGILKLPKYNRTFDHGRPTLDLWEGVQIDG